MFGKMQNAMFGGTGGPDVGMAPGGGSPATGGGGGANAGVALTADEVKEAFREFDLDKNGYVGAAEIAHILQSIGEKATDDEVDEMILMADLDGDGQVSFEEFFKLISSFQGMPPPPNFPGGTGGAGAQAAGAFGAALPPGNPVQDMEAFQKMHGLDNDALKKVYKQFLAVDSDKSGQVDINEFCRLLRVERSQFVERLFGMFDTDKTGTIDLKEFVVGLSNVGTAAREDKVKFAFQVFDLDGSGTIDKDELKKIVKATNMASAKQLDRKTEWLMKQCDADGDGNISYEEFVNLAKKFPNIVFPAYSLASGLGGLK
jgi:serine/threonine-protein phosphatase 2B regulatory subunit|tara:strand:- start:28173 stop:29120 length:948 start_codon:yes stop_codon:yes gene_type:complete